MAETANDLVLKCTTMARAGGDFPSVWDAVSTSLSVSGIDPEIVRIKRAVEPHLLRLPGVRGVAVGFREENGILLDEDAIRVYVSDFSLIHELPKEISGVPVSIVDGRFRLAAGPLLPPDDTRYGILRGGIKIINPSTSTLMPEGWGTMGAVVQDVETRKPLGLTCFHVAGLPQPFPFVVWQPDNPPLIAGISVSLDPTDSLGPVRQVDWPKTQTPEINPQFAGTVDAAVFSLEDGIARGRQISKAILDEVAPVELVPSILGTMNPFKGQRVRKRGFKTRVTHGFVVAVGMTIDWFPQTQLPVPQIPRAFLSNQAEIRGTDIEKNLMFGEPGDSGSVVLDGQSSNAVGLLWAINQGLAVMSPIQEVERRLNIRMAW